MNDVQMCWSLFVECVELLSQMRSGTVLMEGRHGEGQTDKQGLYQRKRSENRRHVHTTSVYVSLRWSWWWSSCCPIVRWILADIFSLVTGSVYEMRGILR